MNGLEEFESMKNWRESLEQSALSRGKPLTKRAWYHRIRSMNEYSTLMSLNPDQLVAEDVDAAMKRLTGYFLWLTGEKVEGLTPKDKSVGWNSACTFQSFIRGFYTHNDVVFPKRFKVPKRKRSEVSKRDSRAPVYEYDEDRELTQMNGLPSHFVSNLNFRDQTIAICLLATGADAADLLSLKIGFVKDGRGQMTAAPRIPWHGNRLKDSVEFRTYFSKEATACLKRYVEQERAGAGDDEPLFVQYNVIEENGEKVKHSYPLNVSTLSENFRGAAERMSYAKKGQANPFRLKRFRHLFREACSAAHIDEGYTQALMGHSSGVSSSYLEKGEGSFLREYIRVEPYVTLFGVDRNGIVDLAETVDGQRIKIEELEGKLTESTDRFTETYDRNVALIRDMEQKDQTLRNWVEKLSQELEGVREENATLKDSMNQLNTFHGVTREMTTEDVDKVADTLKKVIEDRHIKEQEDLESQELEEQERLTRLMKKGKLEN